MKLYFRALALCALFVCAEPKIAQADVSDGTMLNTQTVMPLMRWVEAETGVKVPVLPTVIASHSRLWHMISMRRGVIAGQPQSVFAGSTIILNDRTWDPDDDVQVSLLVHELVHYAQSFMPKSRWGCSDQKEVMAYTLQNRWLEEHGHHAFATHAWIARVSQCEDAPDTMISMAQAQE